MDDWSHPSVVAIDERPKSFALLGRGDMGARRPAVPTDLHTHLRIGTEVEKPSRRPITSAFRGNDDQAFAVF